MAVKSPRKAKKTTRGASRLGKKVSAKTIAKQAFAQRRKQRLFAFRRRLHNESINSITHGIATGMTLSGTALLIAVWFMAICGILFKTRYINRYQFVSTLIYVVMGWSILVGLRSFTAAMANQGLILFFFGGGMYTCGTLFYGWRTLPYHHMIWHLFVLAGATLHFMSLYLFVFK